MKFYRPLTDKFNPIAFILGFIATIAIASLLTGCGAVTEEPVESTYTTTTEYTYPEPTEAVEATEAPEPTQAPVQETEQESIQEPATKPADEPVYYNDNNLNGMPGVEITDTTIIKTNGFKLYNFKKSGSIGATLDPEHYKNMPFELYYGLTVSAEGTVVTYRAYNHLNQEIGIEWTSVESMDTKKWADIRTASFTKDYQFDLVSQDNGLFCLVAEFDNGVKFEVPLYVNDGEVYIAEYAYDTVSDETILGYIDKPARIKEIAESYNVTPEKSLSVNKQDIAYPVLSRYNDPSILCETDLWREKAHEIVTNETLADSVKAIMLHDWMTQNVAYDRYRTNVCKQWRAGYYNDFTGTWAVYNTHTGVCQDFVNIYAIMCRELGIPCGSFENDGHTWNIIWLDNQWYEADLTTDINQFTYKEDVTDVSGTRTICYYGFLPKAEANRFDRIISVNLDLHCANYRQDGYCHDCIHTR